MIRKFKKDLKADFRDRSFKEMVREGAVAFLIRIGGLVAGYAFVFIISRYFGSEVLGAHTLSVTVLMMFTVAGKLGMDTNLVRNFAQAHGDNRWDKIMEVYKKTLSVIIPVGLLLSALLYFTAPLIAERIFEKPMLTPWFRVISFGVLPMVLRFVNSECYRGFGMNREYAYSQNVGYFIYGSVILGVLAQFSDNVLLPNIAFASSLIILAISSSWLIYRKIRKQTNITANEYPMKELVGHSLPMLMTNSMLMIAGWINTILLGIWSTESDVGIYSVVLKIATFGTFMLMSINSIATPRFAQLYAKGDMEQFRKYTAQTAKIIFLTSLPVFAGILLLNDWLLSLFGEEFKVGAMALVITMIGQSFNVFAGSVGVILNMTGHQKSFRNIITGSTIVNVIICFILIPKYGLLGSAIAGAVFMASWNLASLIYIKKKLGVDSFYNPFR